MKKDEAIRICGQFNIPKGENFHALNSDTVARIIEAADSRKYRAPKNANGSRARYFYAMLTRALNSKVPEYVVQGNHGYRYGWEDECSEYDYREARARLKEYRENAPGNYRIITRRVPA